MSLPNHSIQSYGSAGHIPRGDHIAVSIRRGCPNAPNPCGCTGACMRAVTDAEAIEALERRLREIRARVETERTEASR